MTRTRLTMLACALTLASCQRAPIVQSPQDFEAEWHAQIARRDFVAAQKLIDQRAKQNPDDPEVMIARANLYFRKAIGPSAGLRAKPPAQGQAGAGPDSSFGLDTLLARRALDTLRDGIRSHPERLDMRLGLAYLCQQMGQRGAEVEVVEETVGYALQHPNELRWSYGEPLSLPANEFVPSSLHDFVRYYVDRRAPGDDVAARALGEIVMRAYPNSPFVPNDLAYFYGQQGQWAKALDYLRYAERADSTDALVLYNLGWALENLRHHDTALRYYRKAYAVGMAGSQGDVAESARQRLVALGSPP